MRAAGDLSTSRPGTGGKEAASSSSSSTTITHLPVAVAGDGKHADLPGAEDDRGLSQGPAQVGEKGVSARRGADQEARRGSRASTFPRPASSTDGACPRADDRPSLRHAGSPSAAWLVASALVVGFSLSCGKGSSRSRATPDASGNRRRERGARAASGGAAAAWAGRDRGRAKVVRLGAAGSAGGVAGTGGGAPGGATAPMDAAMDGGSNDAVAEVAARDATCQPRSVRRRKAPSFREDLRERRQESIRRSGRCTTTGASLTVDGTHVHWRSRTRCTSRWSRAGRVRRRSPTP